MALLNEVNTSPLISKFVGNQGGCVFVLPLNDGVFVVCGRHAHKALKHSCEVVDAGITQGAGDLGNIHISFPKQSLCLPDL